MEEGVVQRSADDEALSRVVSSLSFVVGVWETHNRSNNGRLGKRDESKNGHDAWNQSRYQRWKRKNEAKLGEQSSQNSVVTCVR